MNVCFSKTDVTPQRPCRMGGYERKKESIGVLDPIEVNYMALEVEQTTILLAMIDCICLEKSFVEDIKKEVSLATGIAQELILISCIHTHSAPCFFKLTFEQVAAESELTKQLKQQIIQDLQYCVQHLKPCQLIYEHCMIDGIYGNRNVKESWSDKSFHLLKFVQGETCIGGFANISTHPTLLNGDNLLLSADLLGHIRNRLQEKLHAPVLISNGTCGDVSTRFYRNGTESLESSSSNIVSQFYDKKVSDDLTLTTCSHWSVDYISISDFKHDPVHQAIRKQIEENPESPVSSLYLHKCDIKESFGRFEMHLHADVIDYGKLLLITLPGDILSAFGKKIKEAFPDKIVILICYSGNYCNYLVPEEQYGKYFETFNSRLQIGEADKFIQKVIKESKSRIYVDYK
ncbi:hypothetical protein [[Eubacterium] hominis]|uniref:hypothetical protein n=1 Tax=[Eubacterium] hominis TaxID=2764325 RepID=UPI003A4DD4EE